MNFQSLPLILFIFFFMLAPSCLTRSTFPDGLWAIPSPAFTSDNQQIMTYFDLNRDRFVDVITRVSSSTGYYLQVYLWEQKGNLFVKAANIDMEIFKTATVIATDFGADGAVEIVVVSQVEEEGRFQVQIVPIQCQQLIKTCQITTPSPFPPFQSLTIPTLLHLDSQVSLLYTSPQTNQLTTKTTMTLTNTTTVPSLQTYDFSTIYMPDMSLQTRSQICTNYRQIFYLDYSGDCVPDLIIHCKSEAEGTAQLLFYRGDMRGKFVSDYRVARTDMLVLGVAVEDINFDGLVDVTMLIAGSSGQMLLQLHYNTAKKQKQQPCTTTPLLPTYFPYHFITSPSQLDQDGPLQIQRIPIQSPSQWSSPLQPLSGNNFIIRTGDINNDGFIDLIIDGPNIAVLLVNQVCSQAGCGEYNARFVEKWVFGGLRGFKRFGLGGLDGLNGKICKMSFFDFYQDGRMDLFGGLCPIDAMAKESPGKIIPIYNALSIDAFFIKITVLDNPSNQPIKSEMLDKKMNIYGAHADFYVSALTGQRIPTCTNQLSHPGPSLQLPYMHTGLGRTNNYIQQLTLTLSSQHTIVSQTWTPIVPNSQLLIAPGTKWLLQTYISPTAVMSILFWFVVVVLAGLGIWIGRLTKMEKMEDKENQDSFYSILR